MELRLTILAVVASLAAAQLPMDYNCTEGVRLNAQNGELSRYRPEAFSCKDKLSLKTCRELFTPRRIAMGPFFPLQSGEPAPGHPRCFSIERDYPNMPVYSQNIKNFAVENCPNFCGFCCQTKTAGK